MPHFGRLRSPGDGNGGRLTVPSIAVSRPRSVLGSHYGLGRAARQSNAHRFHHRFEECLGARATREAERDPLSPGRHGKIELEERTALALEVDKIH